MIGSLPVERPGVFSKIGCASSLPHGACDWLSGGTDVLRTGSLHFNSLKSKQIVIIEIKIHTHTHLDSHTASSYVK